MKLTNKYYLAYIYLIIATSLWAGNILAAKIAHSIMLEPIKLSFYRNIITILILLPFAIRKLIQNYKIYLKNYKIIILLSILSVSVFNTFLNIALTSSSVISSSIFPAFAPSLIILITFILYKVKIKFIQSIGVSISFIGFIIIVLRGDYQNLSQLNFVTGDLWMSCAVISWALYSVILKKIPKNFDTIVFLFLIFFIGNIIIIPFFIVESDYINLFVRDKFSWLIIFYVGIGPALISYLLWIKSIKIIGASKSGLFLNLIPIFSALISIVFLNETIKLFHIVGALLIFLGIYIVSKEKLDEKNY